MRLVTLEIGGRGSPGVVVDEEILDLAGSSALLPACRLLPASVRGLLEAGDAGLKIVQSLVDKVTKDKEVADGLRERGALVAKTKARLLAPIPDPGMVLSGGMNYYEHLKEMNTPVPVKPVAFIKSSSAIVGPNSPILLPRSHPDMVDWEGEFSAVLGRPCHAVSAEDALEYVAGYTIVNDISARDWVAPIFSSSGIMGPIHAWDANILGKQFPTFCPLGPIIVTRDEIKDPNNLSLTTSLNGKVMQAANTNDLVFDIPRLIEHFSRFFLLRPGDIITTGSPAGVGYGRNPKVFMRPGDTIEVSVEGVGVLSNPVAKG